MPRINVLVTDPSRIGCEILKRALEEHSDEFQVVDCATAANAILESVARSGPDLILLSVNLEDGPAAGLNVLHELRRKNVPGRVILLLDSGERATVIAALRGGAKGIFVRDQPVAMLCKCMRQVGMGQIWADSTQLNYLLEELVAESPVRVASGTGWVLTEREEQVAHLVAQGYSNRDISRTLNLSEHTVKNYLFRIFDKLGVSTRVELAMYVVQNKKIA